jgi:chemotaxis protein MotB
MKKISILALSIMVVLSSCGAKKKIAGLEEQQKQLEVQLGQAKMELAGCLDDKKRLQEDNVYLREQNKGLLGNMGEMVVLRRQEAEMLSKSLERIKEKDMEIKRMADAKNKKDSVTLALVTSLKGVLGNMDDEDIQINVEKGVVLVSISDKLLFKSGSYQISDRAMEVLGKVAKVVNNRPGMDVMVEGHTDNKAVVSDHPVLKDNWDLSVYRATAVARVLQEKYNVAPERLIPAGRSYYVPLSSNDTDKGRAQNRRTRIIIMPKIDEFYGLIEEGMKEAK